MNIHYTISPTNATIFKQKRPTRIGNLVMIIYLGHPTIAIIHSPHPSPTDKPQMPQ
jgi:hypothetical protein